MFSVFFCERVLTKRLSYVIILIKIIKTKQERGDKMSDTKTLIVQFSTAEQYNEVRKMAHKHEMNISQFIRYLIDKEKQDMRKEDEGK